MRYLYKLYFLVLLCPILLNGQNLLPPIYNYPIFEYNAASQNWGVDVNDQGELYVANNKGLLHFNGEQWELYKLPNKTVIRSVAYINKRIYTGSYEEIGYWQENIKGKLEYTSLTHQITGHTFSSEEFWQIIPEGDNVVFRSFSRIYRYNSNSIEVINPKSVVTQIAAYKNKVLVAGNPEGICVLKDDKLIPLPNQEKIRNQPIIDLAQIEEGLLIATKQNGYFIWNENGMKPWGKEISQELSLQQLNKIISLSNGKIAFGTIKNGVYLYDPKTKVIERINRQTGLQNNTVLSLMENKEQLWVGMDNGLDRIQLNTPISYYTDYTGIVGTVYDMAFYKGIMYLGSNTGVYYLSDDELTFVKGSQGHVWDLKVIGDDLICGHNSGTYKVDRDQFEPIYKYSGGYQMIKIPEKEDSFLQGTYNGLLYYNRMGNSSWEARSIPGLNFPVKQLCFESPTTVWAAHPYKGLFRIKIGQEYDQIKPEDIQIFSSKDIPNIYNVKVYNIKNQIVIRSEGKWFKYDPIVGKISPFDDFNAYADNDLVYYDEKYFWFIDNEGAKEITITDLKNEYFTIAANQLVKRLVPDSENVIRLNDNEYFLTLGDGFSKINMSNLKKFLGKNFIPSPQLSYVKDQLSSYPINGGAIQIEFKSSREITVQVASPMLVKPRFFYRLTGAEEQSAFTDQGTLKFQNLPFGKYELSVSTVNINNNKSEPIVITFQIAPPWYWSNASVIFYVVLLIGLLLLIRRYNKRKLVKEHLRLKERMQKEQEERLLELEKEKFAKEIKLKQKELAGSILNVTKKNELILELKSILLLNKEKFGNQKRYKSFIKKLDDSINNDEDWKKFEINFKELHEDFFEKLLQSYPDLTPKDLKLCAYLKMNHSSKEIAPLMGISTRGVEIHRYRLRKKLDLEADQNITNFLITFK